MTPSQIPRIQSVLDRHRIDPAALLGAGMEAEVYACDADHVLKIHRDGSGYAKLKLLRKFYDQLAGRSLPFAVPSIVQIEDVDGCLVSIERRLHGEPMRDVLAQDPPASLLSALMHTYIEGAVELSHVLPPAEFARYKLLDPLHLSDRRTGDWNSFLKRYVLHQATAAMRYLERDVKELERKLERLLASLSIRYSGDHRLIHGDFSPGNLLLDDQNSISAVLDFGMMTMFGDPLYEQATAWAFFDMYDGLGVGTRDVYLALLSEQLGASSMRTLYQYVLIYSVIGANSYSPECTDGHYRWCVGNLNNAAYWAELPSR